MAGSGRSNGTPIKMTNGKITALAMVQALLRDGVPKELMRDGRLVAQLTEAERMQLGLS